MSNDKHDSSRQGLIDLLGTEHVSDDIAVMEAYTRDWLPPGVLDHFRPEFVALPATTGEVQSIYKLANRYSFHCIPSRQAAQAQADEFSRREQMKTAVRPFSAF